MNIISTGQMKAQSISIQLSTRERCNARCKFCISRTTPNISHFSEKIQHCDIERLKVGLGYARQLGATHAILTGKSDPTQESAGYIYKLIETSRKYLPLVDFHTNGFLLQSRLTEEPETHNKVNWNGLLNAGLTMITFSIAHYDPIKNRELMGLSINHRDIIKRANELGFLVRASLILCASGIWTFEDVYKYIIHMGELGVHMVVLRELWIPETAVVTDRHTEIYNWNKKNFVSLERIQEYFDVYSSKIMSEKIYRRDPLPWGTPVYVVENSFENTDHGVNVTFARCGEATKGPVMKSIVHKPDGHGYRNWDSNGDILY